MMDTLAKILNRKIITIHFHNHIFDAKSGLQKDFFQKYKILKIVI